jgi:hypothetical protein
MRAKTVLFWRADHDQFLVGDIFVTDIGVYAEAGAKNPTLMVLTSRLTMLSSNLVMAAASRARSCRTPSSPDAP